VRLCANLLWSDLENELQAKMPPPREMIQRGLRLC